MISKEHLIRTKTLRSWCSVLAFILLLQIILASPFVTLQVFTPPRKIHPSGSEISTTRILAQENKGTYTSAVANEPETLISRTVPTLTTSIPIVHQIQSAASLVTFCLGLQTGASVALLLLPSLLYSQIILNTTYKEEEEGSKTSPSVVANSDDVIISNNNRSTMSGGSRTAIIALWARSQMHLQGSGGPDHIAPHFLKGIINSLLGPSALPGCSPTLLLLSICGSLSRLNFRITNAIFEDGLASLLTGGVTGLTIPVHVRTCWLDDCVESFVREVVASQRPEEAVESAAGRQSVAMSGWRGNVVILGAGFDSRSYRLKLSERNMRSYEVDAPGTQREKKRVLSDANVDVSCTTFVSCDFETQDWFQCLVDDDASGFDATLPTLIIWEGMTMYLRRDVVLSTLKTVYREGSKRSGNRWCVAFDYIHSDWAMSPMWKRAMKRAEEPFQFAMTNKEEPEELVRSSGLEMLEHLYDEKELVRRYVPTHRVTGRPIGNLGSYGGFVVAGV